MAAQHRRPVQGERVLIVCNDTDHGRAMARLFEGNGFAVRIHRGDTADIDTAAYGAVVHVEQSNVALVELLGEELPFVKDEEWLLVESDGDDTFHCTVQLGHQATSELRRFVRSLWARFSIT